MQKRIKIARIFIQMQSTQGMHLLGKLAFCGRERRLEQVIRARGIQKGIVKKCHTEQGGIGIGLAERESDFTTMLGV